MEKLNTAFQANRTSFALGELNSAHPNSRRYKQPKRKAQCRPNAAGCRKQPGSIAMSCRDQVSAAAHGKRQPRRVFRPV